MNIFVNVVNDYMQTYMPKPVNSLNWVTKINQILMG